MHIYIYIYIYRYVYRRDVPAAEAPAHDRGGEGADPPADIVRSYFSIQHTISCSTDTRNTSSNRAHNKQQYDKHQQTQTN